MSERDLNLALDTIDQDLYDTKYSEDTDDDLDIVDETDKMFDELDEESVVKYKNCDPDSIDDEDNINFDDDDIIYDEVI